MLGSCVALALFKLVFKLKKRLNNKYRKFSVDALITLCSYLQLHGEKKTFDPDNKNRIKMCVLALKGITDHSLNRAAEALISTQSVQNLKAMAELRR